MTIKELKKKLNITDSDIARMFGYKTKQSYYYSSARERIEDGLVEFYHKAKKEALADLFKSDLWQNHIDKDQLYSPVFKDLLGIKEDI